MEYHPYDTSTWSHEDCPMDVLLLDDHPFCLHEQCAIDVTLLGTPQLCLHEQYLVDVSPYNTRQFIPFNRLPLEIFLGIIRAGQSPKGFQKRLTHEDYLELCEPLGSPPIEVLASHVCRSWRDAVLDDPYLWTNIDVRYGSSYYLLLKCIERSQSHPLNVKIRICEDFNVRSTWYACLPLLYTQSWRWQHFDLVGSDLEAIYCIQTQLQCVTVPLLESLRIAYCGDPERIPGLKAMDTTGRLLALGAPVLQEIVLDGCCPVQLSSSLTLTAGLKNPGLAAIRICTLSAIPWTFGTLQFLGNHCTQLTELTLGYETSRSTELPPMLPLLLPSVVTLNMVVYKKTVTVLKYLLAPTLQTLNCWVPRLGLGDQLFDAVNAYTIFGTPRFPILANVVLRFSGKLKEGDMMIGQDMSRLFPRTALFSGVVNQYAHETVLHYSTNCYMWDEWDLFLGAAAPCQQMRELEDAEIARWRAIVPDALSETNLLSALISRSADDVPSDRVWSSVW